MGISSSFDLSRITNLENRANGTDVEIADLQDGQATKLDLNKTTSQTVKGQTIFTAPTNGVMLQLDPAANGQWLGFWNPIAGRYSMAFGRFATGSEALELRAYWDKFTIRSGRSAGCLNADVQIITNDQNTAGISQNIVLSPNVAVGTAGKTIVNSWLECYTSGAAAGIGLRMYTVGGVPRLASLNAANSDIHLSFAANYLGVRNASDGAWMPIYASAFTVGSAAEYKTDIEDFEGSALEKVKSAKVKKYALKEHDPSIKHIGLIQEEAPEDLHSLDTGINLYSMVSMLWKSVQELSEQVEELKGAAAK